MTNARFLHDIKHLLPNRSDALDFLSYLTGIPYDKLLSHMDEKFRSTSDPEPLIAELERGVPLAYVIGRRSFYGREFLITPDVLIPRYETEILVEHALLNRPVENPRILDLCTGSGTILNTMLAELPSAEGVGVDISPDALDVASMNSFKLGISGRASFICADIMNDISNIGTGYDMVLCNPPYVSEEEYKALEQSVFFEPRQALVAEDLGFAFYKKLLDIVPYLCNKTWVSLLEAGAGQSGVLRTLYSGYKHSFISDLNGIERVLLWKSSS
ncbi:peptide chain release factor N(5)-glutamine methyltransferase [Limisalsivibrio acetivorans]|uniref:peptide chain release factor N(5)-glutamine methyltransferase n=1 Tax=Limisalsivibrio acetivorans TaxID=1304888 RepID=UPI0003B5EAE1|nr:peptide chain release factor N(5)-glutamine methyltransferase [Limisalsivibrio acetivorans]